MSFGITSVMLTRDDLNTIEDALDVMYDYFDRCVDPGDDGDPTEPLRNLRDRFKTALGGK